MELGNVEVLVISGCCCFKNCVFLEEIGKPQKRLVVFVFLLLGGIFSCFTMLMLFGLTFQVWSHDFVYFCEICS